MLYNILLEEKYLKKYLVKQVVRVCMCIQNVYNISVGIITALVHGEGREQVCCWRTGLTGLVA